MDLHYLKIFYEVAKEKSFTKAATKLYINQSAVSIQIKKFEELLNAKLFDRSSKKIRLTYTGEALYRMAEDIFNKVQRAEKEINRIIKLGKAKIIIGSTSIIGDPLLPKLMKEFSEEYPEIEYEIQISDKPTLLKTLKEGGIDIALVDEEHIVDPNLDIITVEKVPYYLITSDENINPTLLKTLKEGGIDIALVDEEHIVDPNLDIITVEKVPYYLITSDENINITNVADYPLISRNNVPNNLKAINFLEEKYQIVEKVPYYLITSDENINITNVADYPLISRNNVPNNLKAINFLEEKYQINFDNRIIVQGSLQIIKGMVKNKLANVILPYYAIDKEIKNGEFKVIEEIVDVKDGYQVIVTKDKNTLVPIIKFLNFISSYKLLK